MGKNGKKYLYMWKVRFFFMVKKDCVPSSLKEFSSLNNRI